MRSTIFTNIIRQSARASFVLLLATGALSAWAQGTITSNGTNFVRAVSSFDTTPTADFTGAGPTGDQVFEFGWAYRVNADTQERFMPAPTTQAYVGDTSTISWTALPNGGLNAQEVTQVTGFDAPDTAHVISTMTFTNNTAAVVSVNVYVAIDIDQNGSAATDNVTLNAPNNAMVITDVTFGNFVGVGANSYMARPFAAATDVFGLLGDALVTNLDNTGIPMTGDFTGAYQWATVSIPVGESRSFVAQFSANRNVPFTGANADVSLALADAPDPALEGGALVYTATATNNGPDAANDIAITMPVPANTTFVNATGGTCVGAGPITCTFAGATASTASVISTFNFTVNAGAAAASPIVASASVANTVADSNMANNTANASTVVTAGASADLSITKTDGVVTAAPGGSVTYTITASNAGPSPAPINTVSDTFPAELTCTWTCAGAGGGTCTAAGSGNINDTGVALPSGGSVTYTASCTISAAASGTLVNTATVFSCGQPPFQGQGCTVVPDPVLANNSATDTDMLGASADLAITKTDGVTTATPGGSVTYTIVASNAGPSASPVNTVSDTFPAELTCTWTCAGAGGGTCTAAGSGNINDAVVALPSGGSVTYTASCTISGAATGTLVNTATVFSCGQAPFQGQGCTVVPDPSLANNSATDSDVLGAAADLAITKTDGVTTVAPGGALTYTIVASNAGPSAAPGSTVADTFPASLTCTWTCAGAGGGTCTAAGSGNINDTVNLPSGGSVTYTASCSVSGAASGTVANTATVATGAGVTDPTPANNSATDTDTVIAPSPANVSGTKTVSGTFQPGSAVTYTVVLTNSGAGAQADNPGDEFTDVLPAGLTLVSASASSGTAVATVATNTVTWNGSIPASGGSVTITINATINPSASGTIANQGTISFDGDGNGSNESTAQTDNPATATPADATVFGVLAPNVPVPTLNWIGLALLALLVGAVGLRRQHA